MNSPTARLIDLVSKNDSGAIGLEVIAITQDVQTLELIADAATNLVGKEDNPEHSAEERVLAQFLAYYYNH